MQYIIKRTVDLKYIRYFAALHEDTNVVDLAQDECLAQRFTKKSEANEMAIKVFGQRAFMLYWRVIKIKTPEGV